LNVTARIVRVFSADTPAGGVVEQRLVKVLELPLDPIRGHRVELPGIEAPLAIARVIVRAVEGGVRWEPGFVTPRITCELEPELPDGMAAAFAGGWKAV
jgi:hypothetical protein